MEIGEIRTELDQVDKEICSLFEKRMKLCEEVARTKILSGKPVLDRTREQQKLDAVAREASNELNARGLRELYSQIMCLSRKLQYTKLMESGVIRESAFIPVDNLKLNKMRVVFQGTNGAYSQLAGVTYFGDDAEAYPVDTFRDAMCAIEEGRADYAVLPIENSTAGVVDEMYDLLVEFENHIVGEQIIGIEHALLGCKDSELSDIRTVYSHPQALMQCQGYLREHADFKQVSYLNTAMAAKKVFDDQDKSQAAIANPYTAQLYGLKILQKKINDEKENSTRFIIVAGKKIYCKNASKISLCFEIPHAAGSLYQTLSHLIYNGLNMTKIESRPVRERNWEYRFFVDFEGNLSDVRVKNALAGLRAETTYLKILGNY